MAAFVVMKKVRKAGVKPTRIARDRLRIGRGGENDIDLDDFLVSPLHCEIEWIGGQFRLSDAGSITGTFVDGKPIEKYFPLATGHTITVGLNRLEIAVDLAKQECTATLVENIGTGEKTLHKVAFLRERPWYLQPKNHVAGGLAIVLVPVALLLALGRCDILMNGALARAHAVDARTGRAIACAACHVPARGASAERCAACHEAAVGPGTTHPIAARAVAGLGCARCHNEHQGEAARLVPAWVPPAECRACHAEAHRGEASRPGARSGMRAVEVRFDAFDHGAHARAGISDCATCHRPAEGGATDFARMGYEGCVACHAHRPHAVEAHGTGVQCAACHAGPKERALALVDRPPGGGAVVASFAPQHHDLGQRCERCHAGTARDLPARASGKRFDHWPHLPSLVARTPDERGALSARCAACHAEVARATTVETSHAAPPESVCATCHTRVEAIRRDAPPASDGVPAKVVRFSHAAHAKTACIECHAFGEDRPGAAPRVGGAPADCATCHLRDAPPGALARPHVDAGLDACVHCHRGANDLFEQRAPARIERPAISFSHRSPTHATLACDACHDDARRAATVSALRFPSFESEACQRCHGAAAGGGDLDCVQCHAFHRDAMAKKK